MGRDLRSQLDSIKKLSEDQVLEAEAYSDAGYSDWNVAQRFDGYCSDRRG